MVSACALSAGCFAYSTWFGMVWNDWNFLRSTYFFAITTSTVGYSDMGIAEENDALTQWLLIVYMWIAVACSTAVLGLLVAVARTSVR